MRAVLTPAYGGPEVLEFGDVPDPEPGPAQLLVDVDAVAVTRGDDRLRGGEFPGFSAVLGRLMFGFFRPRQPRQGTMFAGRVAEGSSLTRFSLGAPVFGEVPHGAFAERLVLDEGAGVAAIPEGFEPSDVAALGYGAATAWVYCHELADIGEGQRVVVLGAGGGVGRYAVQISRHLGAEVVPVAGMRHREMLATLGFSSVHGAEEVKGPVDVVLDTTGRFQLRDWVDRLRPSGCFLSTDISIRLFADLLWSRLAGGPSVHFGVGDATAANLAVIAELLRTGALVPVVARQFDFEHMAQAHRCLHEERPSGDVVVNVGVATR